MTDKAEIELKHQYHLLKIGSKKEADEKELGGNNNSSNENLIHSVANHMILERFNDSRHAIVSTNGVTAGPAFDNLDGASSSLLGNHHHHHHLSGIYNNKNNIKG